MKPIVLVTGGDGMLAHAVRATWSDCEVRAFGRRDLDVTDASALRRTIHELRPEIVVHCAAYTQVDRAESEFETAFAINAESTATVAAAVRDSGALLIYPSTDYVFDGCGETAYQPDTTTGPVNAYGRSKLAGEIAAREATRHLIVRTSWLYGPGGRNFIRMVHDRLGAGEHLRVVDDQIGCPTWTFSLAWALRELAVRAPTGTYHFCDGGRASWFDVALEIARAASLPENVTPCSTAEYPTPARRPRFSLLDCSATEAYLAAPRANWKSNIRTALASERF